MLLTYMYIDDFLWLPLSSLYTLITISYFTQISFIFTAYVLRGGMGECFLGPGAIFTRVRGSTRDHFHPVAIDPR